MQFSNRGFISAAFPAMPQADIDAVVSTAAEGGISWFDTAEMYGAGTSERCLSRALTNAGLAPGDVAIATKWRQVGRSAANIGRTIEDRIAALHPYPIDLYQIHWPIGSLSSIRAEVRAMGELVASGKVRAVGVSNFSARQMRIAHDVLGELGVPLASNQVQINLLHRNVERNGVLEEAARLGVTLIAYSPLASGLLTGRFHDDPAAAAKLPFARRLVATGPRGGRLRKTRELIEGMRAIGNAQNASISQVALAWLVNNYGGKVVAIPGASKARQAAEAAAVTRIGLTTEECAELAQLSDQAAS